MLKAFRNKKKTCKALRGCHSVGRNITFLREKKEVIFETFDKNQFL